MDYKLNLPAGCAGTDSVEECFNWQGVQKLFKQLLQTLDVMSAKTELPYCKKVRRSRCCCIRTLTRC
jgi:hypothetical protein